MESATERVLCSSVFGRNIWILDQMFSVNEVVFSTRAQEDIIDKEARRVGWR